MSLFLLHLLAQAAPAPQGNVNDDRMHLFYILCIIMAIVVIGFIALMFMRNKLKTTATTNSADVGFSLSSLREMRDRGEITSEEYEVTKAKVIAKTKSAAAAPPKPKHKPLEEDFRNYQ